MGSHMMTSLQGAGGMGIPDLGLDEGGEGGPSCQKKVQHGSHDVGMACLEPTLSGGIGLQG